MFADKPLLTNICTTDIQKAKAFYGGTLGMKLVGDFGEAATFESAGAMLFIYQRDAPPKADHTVANWEVTDIHEAVAALREKGVQMERYEGMDQDETGISARSDNGPWAAWFKDPDGNTLAVIQPPA